MKRMIACILLMLLTVLMPACSSGWGQQANAPTYVPQGSLLPETYPDAGTSDSLFDPVTDCDNRYINLEGNIAELDGMLIWSHFNDYLHYYDKETGDTGVLCAKPECMHDEKPGNTECLAYTGGSHRANSVSYYCGQIYWVGGYRQNGSYEQNALYRMNPDSSGKELLFSFNPPDGYAPQEYMIHRGRLYLRCVTNRVTDGVPGMSLAILSTPIEKKDFRMDYETVVPDRNAWSNIIRFIGDNVYFAYTYDADGEDGYVTKVIRHDINTGENEEILSDDALTEPLRSFWIEPGGTMIFTQYGYDPEASIWRSDNGEQLRPIAKHHDEDGRFRAQFVSDGVIIGSDGASPGDQVNREIWMRDFEGKTLFKGLLTTDFLKGTPYEGQNRFGAVYLGNKESIFWIPSFKNPDYGKTPAEDRNTYFLICYRLTENGLVEEPLIMVHRGR
ncbi:MAG: hypothetical protein J5544_06895 [Clostridia bacterium]|nr:hypothetical protein [Clostridia bacterium]